MDPAVLLNKLKHGDITNIVSDVKVALDGPGHSALAHRAIIRINKLCFASDGRTEPVITDDDVVLELAITCCRAILHDIREDSLIEWNIQTLTCITNILIRFNRNINASCSIKLLKSFLPILEKTRPSHSEQEQKITAKLIVPTHSLVLLGCEKICKDTLQFSKESNLLELWDLMLRVFVLDKFKTALPTIFSVLMGMSMKYENSQISSNVNEMFIFQKALLDKLIACLKANNCTPVKEEILSDKIFMSLIPCLRQLVRIDMKSGSIGKAQSSIQSMSECVLHFLPAHSHHMECFNLILRVYQTFLFRIDDLPDVNLFVKETQSFSNILRKHEKNGLSSAVMWVVFCFASAIISLGSITKGVTAMKPFFSARVLSAMNEITKCVSKLALRCSNSTCHSSSGEACPLKQDVVLAFNTLNVFVNLCVEYKRNKEEWVEVWPMILDVLQEQQSVLNFALSKKCLGAKALEKSLYENYYSVGLLCFKAENWKHSQRNLLSFLNYVFRTWETDNNMYQQRLVSLVVKLSVSFEKQGFKREAQYVILLHVALQLKGNAPQDPYLCQRWSSLQNEEPSKVRRADELLHQESALIKSMCPSFDLSSELIPNLLLWELSCYDFFRLHSSEFILDTWLTLRGSNPSALLMLQGSAHALRALFSIEDKTDWNNKIPVSLSSLLHQVKPSEKSVALCSAAVHYQIKFLIMAQKHFDENESRVKEEPGHTFNPARVKLPSEVVDPSDICQIGSSFQNLNIKQEHNLMATLDSAVNYWNESLDAGLNEADYSMYPVVSLSGECLAQTAFLYSLWGYHAAAAKTWHVCSKYARKMGQDELLLQALSGLMNTVEVKPECISEADELLNRLSGQSKNSFTTKMYNTSKAFQALRTQSYTVGIEALKNVVSFVPTTSSVWCFTYAKLLHASYALLPKSLVNVKDLGENNVQCLAHDGLRYSTQQVQQRRLSSSPLVFAAVAHHALSSSLWIGRFYLHSKMPREARCYLKAELKLALKMGLATRAAEFICELAFIDLLTEKVDEAGAKIVEIEGILEIKNGLTQDKEGEVLEAVFSGINRLNIDNKEENCASPSLQMRRVFNLPFRQHKSSCKCYTCSNVSVQHIWLMYNHLQAKTCTLKFCAHDAMMIYKQTFSSAMAIIQKLQQDSSLPGILLLQHQLACTVICLRLDLVDMLAMYEKDKDALKWNKATLSMIHDLKTHESKLFVEALDQKMAILNIIEKKERKTAESIMNQTGLPTSPADVIVKTPKSNAYMEKSKESEKKRSPLKALKNSKQLKVPKRDKRFIQSLKLDSPFGSGFEEPMKDSLSPPKLTVNDLSLDLEVGTNVNNFMPNPAICYDGESSKGRVTSRTSKIPHLKSTYNSKSKIGVKDDDASQISSKSSIDNVTKVFSDTTSVPQKSGRNKNVATCAKQVALRPIKPMLLTGNSKSKIGVKDDDASQISSKPSIDDVTKVSGDTTSVSQKSGRNKNVSTCPQQLALRPIKPELLTGTQETLKRTEKEVNLDKVESNKSKKYVSSMSVVEKAVNSDKVGSSKSKSQVSSKPFTAEGEVASGNIEGTRTRKQASSKSISVQKELAVDNNSESMKSKKQVSSTLQSVNSEATKRTRQKKN